MGGKIKKLIIGITGAFGSGKTTAAKFLQDKGFKKVSLAKEFLEVEAREQGMGLITRKILQDIGNQFRKKYGSGILAKKALRLLERNKVQKAVIDGIRNIGEIDELRKNGGILIAIIADRKVRFGRLKRLKRRERLTWELFTKLDRRDLGLGQKKTGLQVVACQALADVFIENNGELAEFKNKLENFLQKVN